MASFLTNGQTYPKNLEKKKKEGTSLNHENPNAWEVEVVGEEEARYIYSFNYIVNFLIFTQNGATP